jgi:hypothetical protein
MTEDNKKRLGKKLSLKKETIRELGNYDLRRVAGGGDPGTIRTGGCVTETCFYCAGISARTCDHCIAGTDDTTG